MIKSARTKGSRPGFSMRSGARVQRAVLVAAAYAAAAACATAPQAASSIAVEVGEGEQVELWGVAAKRTGTGIHLTGNAKRRLAPGRPLDEHLHAETISPTGEVIETRDVAWNSVPSLRTRRSATFSTTFEERVGVEVERVRLTVIPGAVHFAD